MIDAVPYPWPFDGSLPALARMALVLVAPQRANAWMDATGVVKEACGRLLSAAQRTGMPVIVTLHIRQECTPARLAVLTGSGSTKGALLGSFDLPKDVTFVEAPALDGFYATGLDALLWQRRISYLVFAGFGTETMVHSTLRSANDRGFECLVLEDACADGDPDLHAASMSSIMMSGGIFGAYTKTALFLDALSTPISKGEAYDAKDGHGKDTS